MRVAWFRAAPFTSREAPDASSAVISVLTQTVAVDIITEARAHDFVIDQALRPYDVCVFEPRNDPGSDFIWAYLFQYPGILFLQSRSLHDSRTRALERRRHGDAYESEFLFNHGHGSRAPAGAFSRGSWPMLRAPILASRLVVVSDEQRRLDLQAAYPGARVRVVPACAAGPLLLDDAIDPEVVVAMDPVSDDAPLTLALSYMARGAAVIVLEREATAAWPAFDPQTWRPRGPRELGEPVVVSIDPRDEEHSVKLARLGLGQDSPRRHSLGVAARKWWLAHSTPERAARVWLDIIREGAGTLPASLPLDWPVHLRLDGLERVRAISTEFDITSPL